MNDKIELVELEELPAQEGTEFVIVYCYVGDCMIIDYSSIYADEATISNGKFMYFQGKWRPVEDDEFSIVKILALPHAELRALYKENGGINYDFEYSKTGNDSWRRCVKEPMWFSDLYYRYNPKPKQKYILINNERVPEPIKHKLEVGERYYFADLYALNVGFNYWDNCLDDKKLLELRYIHSTKDNAQKHLDAIIKANNQEGIYLDD